MRKETHIPSGNDGSHTLRQLLRCKLIEQGRMHFQILDVMNTQ
jgi:hypothetical protein